LLLIAVTLAAAELTSRLDDWIAYDTPLLAIPHRERDLILIEGRAVRGRPYGHFKKWHLNEWGFRGDDLTREPPAGCDRIMVLGASETFGLYESERMEFPAQLAARLKAVGCHEVVNAAIPGMTVKRMVPYWTMWASRFAPRVVLVYPSPMFYLDEPPPALSTLAAPAPSWWEHSRALSRAHDVYRAMPRFMKRLRERWVVARAMRGRSDAWLFRTVPADRVALYANDLTELLTAIRAQGAQPMVITHATRAAWPPRPEDLEDAEAMRMIFPRATAEVILAFERVAAAATERVAADLQVPVIDVAAALAGRRELFADLVHFNDDGAALGADVIAAALRRNVAVVGQTRAVQ